MRFLKKIKRMRYGIAINSNIPLLMFVAKAASPASEDCSERSLHCEHPCEKTTSAQMIPNITINKKMRFFML